MREIDRLTTERHNIPSIALMESASAACLEAIRARFDRRYTATRMAHDYLAIYRRLLKGCETDDTKGVARRTMKVVHNGALLPAASGQ